MNDAPKSTHETIFVDALALPSGERNAFVDRACAGDLASAAQVKELLRGYEENSGFLEASPAGVDGAVDGVASPESGQRIGSASGKDPNEAGYSEHLREPVPGERIGHYKLLERIGEGACGIVYMAEQEQPVRRRVALKLIKLGLDTRDFIARFEAERQALALMDHANIARVFDAGATDKGRPYFVMELVRGVPITRYCDENHLAPRARLELFITVCHAIQHAHQKGIIHRDIKPSNILVAVNDGEAVPKVIDFGIAKATQGRLTDKTVFTRFHAFIGTPAYSSPEQAEVTNLDVDTRSDIYSLGVLLYELLTGHQPLDHSTMERLGFEEMRRLIREVEPPRPSARVSSLGLEERTSVAQRRNVDSAKLALLLRSDLDWIVMRCLEKDRRRRYETASALALDIRRHLENEPVAARPPSTVYRMRKFVGRHRSATLGVAGIAAALVAGLIVSSVLLVRERVVRERAVAAERAENELRVEAEAGRVREIKRSARTALSLSQQLLADGRTADGLAYLVHAARRDPENTAIAARLAAVLTSRNFLLPEHVPFECGSRVIALHYTADGRSLLAGTEDGALRIFDAATGALVREVRLGQEVKRNGWIFARDNDTVCAVRFVGDTLGVLDIAAGRLRFPALALDPRILPGEGCDPAMLDAGWVRMSPDGRWILADSMFEYWIWDAMHGTLVAQRTLSKFKFCAFSPDGTRFAQVSDDALTLWSLPGFERISGPTAVERNVARPGVYLLPNFSRDGRELVVVDPFEAFHLFDASTGAFRRSLPNEGKRNWIRPGFLQFLPDGRLFGEGSHSYVLWDLRSGAPQELSSVGYANLSGVAFDAKGERMLLTTRTGFARLMSTTTGEMIAEESSLHENGDVVAALSPDGGQIAAGTNRGQIRWLRVGRGAARPLEVPAIAAGFTTALSPQIRSVTTTASRFIDVRTGREIGATTANPRPLSTRWSVPWFSPGARFLVAPHPENAWEAWDFSGGGAPRVVPLEGRTEMHFFEFSPEGSFNIFWNEKTRHLGVWNLATGGFTGPLVSYGDEIVGVWNLGLSPEGRRLAAAFSDGTVGVWDTATGRRETTLQQTSRASPAKIDFSPDGRRLAVSTVWGEARVWDAQTGLPVSPPFEVARGAGVWQPASGVLFSPDGRWLATVGERGLTLRDAATFEAVRNPIDVEGAYAGSTCFSRDGTRLSIGLSVWDVPGGERITDPTDEDKLPGGLSFPQLSADARYLLYMVQPPGGMVARVRSVPPQLPKGERMPEWLLRLATILAARTVNDAEESVAHLEPVAGMDALRRDLSRLPADAPYVEWGRWILDDRPDRPIAPGFTITAAEMAKLAGDASTAK